MELEIVQTVDWSNAVDDRLAHSNQTTTIFFVEKNPTYFECLYTRHIGTPIFTSGVVTAKAFLFDLFFPPSS